ncbi:Xaa-Pro aminopeptidase [Sphingomonas sp. YR710]|uniref:M24 family metallopeptidase n=1 Tax=Sphingomonas sp. YR710 TaxID=1882773 RepID=UPI0008852B8F|nr:M24 family metallopeptidase [Sphingomonas sp. YR710]SDC82594.1 Xaa-Pro aminopeptidase [Sphingomonas sp. YR710]
MLLNRDRADALMDREGVSAIVASINTNVYYLSGWATYAAWHFGDMALVVLPRDHDRAPAIITTETDSGQPQQFDGPWMQILRTYRRKVGMGVAGRPVSLSVEQEQKPLPANHAEVVAAYLLEIGLTDATIGFDDRGLGYDVAEKLGSGLKVRDARDLMRDIRMVKTPDEIRLIRAATRKTEFGMEAVVEALASGATCNEAERAFWSVVPLVGGRPVFLLITPYRPGVGKIPKDWKLEPGDTVTLDTTAAVRHYTSDVGRTVVIGEPTAAQIASYDAVRRGWSAALSEFRAGAMSDAVERAVVASIQAHGNIAFTGASIHSVGLEHTDHPHPGNSLGTFEMVDGSVLSCDLPWVDPVLGRFHLENLIYLNGGTVELLDASGTSLYSCVDGRAIRVE